MGYRDRMTLTKLDRELDDILANGNTMDYINLTLFQDTAVRHTTPADQDIFIPKLEDNSVSIFGTLQGKVVTTEAFKCNTIDNQDDIPLMSPVTLDSRISTLETEFSTMTDMLTKYSIRLILVIMIPIRLPLKLQEAQQCLLWKGYNKAGSTDGKYSFH